MSKYAKVTTYDLFSSNFIAEEQASDFAQEMVETGDFKNYSEVADLKAKRVEQKLQILNGLSSVIVLTGEYHKLQRQELVEFNNRRVSDGNDEIILGYEKDGKKHFFTQNIYNPVEVICEDDFLNRVKTLAGSEEELIQMILVEVFVSSKPVEKSMFGQKELRLEDFQHSDGNKGFGSRVGYENNALRIHKVYIDKEWKIELEFLNQTIQYSFDEMVQLYKEFAQSLNTKMQNSLSLSSLSNWELIAWYKTKAFNLKWNVITNEWTIKKAYSNKEMCVGREELLDYEEFEMKHKRFVTLNNPVRPLKRFERSFFNDDAFAEKYAGPIELKPFTLGKDTFISFYAYEEDVVPDGVYTVGSDDGRYVELLPVKKGDKTTEVQPMKSVKMPRANVFMVCKKTGDETITMVAPYAIPVDVENSAVGLIKERERFVEGLSELEYKQSLAIDHFYSNHLFLTAMKEKDYEYAKTLLYKNGSSRGVKNKCHYYYDNGVVSYVTAREGNTKIKMPVEQLFEVFFDMYSAIQNSPNEELTLFELELKYLVNHKVRLSTTGIRSFFLLDAKRVHTSKYNLLDIEGTLKRLGLINA